MLHRFKKTPRFQTRSLWRFLKDDRLIICVWKFVYFWTVEDAGPYRLVVYSVVIVRHRGTSSPTGWFVMRGKHLFSAAPLHSSLFTLLSYPASFTAVMRASTETLDNASTVAVLVSRSNDTTDTPFTPSRAFFTCATQC